MTLVTAEGVLGEFPPLTSDRSNELVEPVSQEQQEALNKQADAEEQGVSPDSN